MNYSKPLTLSVFANVDGNVTYTVSNGNNTESWSYHHDISSGYVYVSNRAGSSDQTVRNLIVSHNVSRTNTNQWIAFGDTNLHRRNGTARLNGNPG